jgi:hypothetical protein
VFLIFFFIRIEGCGVHTGSTRYVGKFWPIASASGDFEDGESGGMKLGRVNRNTQRKPALAPFCPPQIHLTRPGRKYELACVSVAAVTFLPSVA